ncbi:unnamed protein product, partial [marine sediment metagenome]
MKSTVVIPALNEEEFIEANLKSIRAQTVPPDEIIVMDNGSTDKTVEIAEKYADRVIIMPDVGIVQLRQAGAEAAKNPIIVSTDADTIYPEFWLEKLLRHFSDPNVVAVGGSIRPSIPGSMEKIYANGLNTSASTGLFLGANMAFRRDALLKSGGYIKVKRAEDWALATRLRSQGRIVYDPEAYVITDVPFSRQLEFAAIAANAGLLGVGIATNAPVVSGSSVGFLVASVGTAIDDVPDDIHHSQIAVAGLALTTALRGHMTDKIYRFIMGVFTGIMEHHFLTEDVFDPVWAKINGS